MAYSEKYKRILHRLGYYDYQNGLIYRHLGQEDGWNGHLDNCRKFILKAIDQTRPEKITVLGSGWLLDLPLKEILDSVRSVTLVDIIHPPEALRQVSAFKNVVAVEADVTGGLIDEVWNKSQEVPFFSKLKTLSGISVPEYDIKEDPGLVISLNILSQLEVLPISLLRKRSSAGEEEYTRLRNEIQKKHIDFLFKHNSILISDYSEIFTDRNGISTEVKTVVTELPAGKYTERWRWDFDLKGSDYFEKRSVMNVIALTL